MKVAVIGSRKIKYPNLDEYLPNNCSEIVSGGADGVDQFAADYAHSHHIIYTEFLPEYHKYGRAAPLIRNRRIVEYADFILAFWDGTSRGTSSVIQYCKKTGKPCQVIHMTIDP